MYKVWDCGIDEAVYRILLVPQAEVLLARIFPRGIHHDSEHLGRCSEQPQGFAGDGYCLGGWNE